MTGPKLAAPQPSQVATPKPNGGKDLAEKTESKVAAQLRERMDLYARSQITWGELRKDIEAALFAAPHPPVSAEAGKGVAGLTLTQDNTKPGKVTYIRQLPHGFLVGVEGHLPYKFKGERADIRLALAPSESVAVSGEVSDTLALLVECRDAFPVPPPGSPLEQAWAQAMGEPECIPDYLRAAVLALAGSAKQAAALERMARLDDEMGIEP